MTDEKFKEWAERVIRYPTVDYADAEKLLREFAQEVAAPRSATWPIVLWFAGEMEKKLAENRHKGDAAGWRKDSPWSLARRIDEERLELLRALNNFDITRPETVREIIREAADVANFAMMIGDQANEAMNQQKETEETKP